MGMSGRNPLDLIKTDAPLLSEATTSKAKRALAPLLDAAGRDEACVWYRVGPTSHALPGLYWVPHSGTRLGPADRVHLLVVQAICSENVASKQTESLCQSLSVT